MVPLLVLVLIAPTGCVQLPRPVDADPVPPSWTLAAATARRAEVLAGLSAAVKKQALPSRLVSDQEAEAVTASFLRHRDRGEKLTGYADRAGKVIAVYAPFTRAYPRSAAVVVSLAKPYDGYDRMVEVYTREGAARPWLLANTALASSKQLPLPAAKADGASSPPPRTVNGVDTRSGKRLAAAVQDPGARTSAWLRPGKTLSLITDVLKKNQQAYRNRADVRGTFAPAEPTHVLSDGRDGALWVVSIRFTETIELKDDGYWMAPKGWRKEFPYGYATASDTYLVTYLVHVPRQGKSAVLSYDVSLLASGYDDLVTTDPQFER